MRHGIISLSSAISRSDIKKWLSGFEFYIIQPLTGNGSPSAKQLHIIEGPASDFEKLVEDASSKGYKVIPCELH